MRNTEKLKPSKSKKCVWCLARRAHTYRLGGQVVEACSKTCASSALDGSLSALSSVR